MLGARNFGGGVAGGIVGGITATVAIFLPSFIFIALLGRVLPKIRQNRYAAGALRAMNAAVVALIVVVAWRLGASALMHDHRPQWFSITIAAGSLLIILLLDVNTTWLILASALAGTAVRFL